MSTCMNKSKQLLNSRNTVSQQILAAVTNPIVVDKSTDHAKPHLICFFYHNIKDNERNLCQDLLTIEGLRAKRAYIAFLANFHFLQDRANFWQTDL